MAEYFILMADIIKSRSYDGRILNERFHDIVSACNLARRRDLLSPLTITLGDEFQGILQSLPAAVRVIYFLEEALLKGAFPFTLRYVLYQGDISTPINKRQ